MRIKTSSLLFYLLTYLLAANAILAQDPFFCFDPARRIPYYEDPSVYSRDSYQWNLENGGYDSTLYDPSGNACGVEHAIPRADIHAREAWTMIKSAPNITIAVIDSGVDTNHPDLRTLPGIGFRRAFDCSDYQDYTGHGTAVIGLINALWNGKGIMGICSNVNVLPIATQFEVEQVTAGIFYAVTNGAQIINCSWGFDTPDTNLLNAFLFAMSNNVICVCAAADVCADYDLNEDYPLSWHLPNVIMVTSSTAMDTLYGSAGYGTNVDIAAPGRALVTTGISSVTDYVYVTGTSFAAPQVAAVCALVKQKYPNEPYWMTIDRVVSSADKVGIPVRGGRLNAYNALTYVPPAVSIAIYENVKVSVSSSSVFPWTLETSTNINDWHAATNPIVGSFSVSFPIGPAGFFRVRR